MASPECNFCTTFRADFEIFSQLADFYKDTHLSINCHSKTSNHYFKKFLFFDPLLTLLNA